MKAKNVISKYYELLFADDFSKLKWIIYYEVEPIIQRVSQKEKHQYTILMHIYGI